MVSGADRLLNELGIKCGFNDTISLDVDAVPKHSLMTLKMIGHDSCGTAGDNLHQPNERKFSKPYYNGTRKYKEKK